MQKINNYFFLLYSAKLNALRDDSKTFKQNCKLKPAQQRCSLTAKNHTVH